MKLEKTELGYRIIYNIPGVSFSYSTGDIPKTELRELQKILSDIFEV